MSRRIHSAITGAACLILSCAVSASAQVTNAAFYGSVRDTSGAAIVGARVSLQSEAAGTVQTMASNETGDFTFPFVPVGRYTASVHREGFRERRQRGLEFSAGQDVRMTFVLEPGAASESITVEASVPLVNTVNAQQQETQSTLEVRELPLNSRDWAGLLRIGTGTAQSAYLSRGQAGGVVMNGLPPSAVRLTVDGTESSENPEVSSIGMFGGFNVIRGVSLEAIAELNVTKGVMSAEIADTMSGNINVITKSGTNQFHGSLFENYQSHALNARNQFLATKPPVVFNQFGGSLGGPVLRNRLFFFGVYEGYRQRRFAVLNATVATKEWRDRAIAAVPAYRGFFDLQPLPTAPYAPGARAAVFQGSASNSANDNHFVGRGDYHLNASNIASFRWTQGEPDQLQPRPAADNPRRFQGGNKAGTLNYIHIRPSWSSEARLGYKRAEVLRVDGIFELGISGLYQNNQGFGDAGEMQDTSGTTWSVEEVVARSFGRHSLKFGALLGVTRQARNNVEVPEVRYCSDDDFLANVPCSIRVTWGVNPYELRGHNLGFFFQDDIRVGARLSLNVGVRYDYYSVPEERDMRLFNRGAPFGFGPLRPLDRPWDADRNNFSPRLGFAWNVDGASRTVVRGGAGVFHSRPALLHAIDGIRNALDEPFRVMWSRAEAIRDGLSYPVTNAATLPLVKGRDFEWTGAAVNERYRTPFSMQWQFGIQRQLTGSMALESSYVGNRGVRLHLNRDMNLVDRITGVRPVAGFGQFRYQDNSDSSRYNAWQTSLRKRYSNSLLFNAHYTWSSALSYQDGDLATNAVPQDPFNLALDRGPAPHDVRHRLVGDAVYELPLERWLGAGGRAARALLRGWQAAVVTTVESGAPLNLPQNNSLLGQRPDYLGGNPYREGARESLVYLNAAAFARVPVSAASGATVRPGNLGRNALRMPGLVNFDVALSRNVYFAEGVALQLRADLFNALNHTNFSVVSANINAANFGRFTATQGARQAQVNARLTF